MEEIKAAQEQLGKLIESEFQRIEKTEKLLIFPGWKRS
mgnify:CR=1 FL=1